MTNVTSASWPQELSVADRLAGDRLNRDTADSVCRGLLFTEPLEPVELLLTRPQRSLPDGLAGQQANQLHVTDESDMGHSGQPCRRTEFLQTEINDCVLFPCPHTHGQSPVRFVGGDLDRNLDPAMVDATDLTQARSDSTGRLTGDPALQQVRDPLHDPVFVGDPAKDRVDRCFDVNVIGDSHDWIV